MLFRSRLIMKFGIQFYYCCRESDYDVFEFDDKNKEFIEYLDSIYEGMMTEVNFVSKKFMKLTEYITENDINNLLSNADGYSDCDYQFLYIICD